MKNALAVAVLLVGIAALGVAQAKAPNFSLKTAEGQVVELAKLQGKAVAVNFWATWCGPCRSEIPGMLEVYGKYRGQGVEIVGVSLDRGGFKDVTPFVKKFNIAYPIVVGNDEIVEAYGGVEAIPTTFFIDKKGNVVKKHVGYMSKEEFEKNIKLAM